MRMAASTKISVWWCAFFPRAFLWQILTITLNGNALLNGKPAVGPRFEKLENNWWRNNLHFQVQQFSCYDYYGTAAFIWRRHFRPFLIGPYSTATAITSKIPSYSRRLLIVQTSQKEVREFKAAFLLMPNSNFHIIILVRYPKSKQSFQYHQDFNLE